MRLLVHRDLFGGDGARGLRSPFVADVVIARYDQHRNRKALDLHLKIRPILRLPAVRQVSRDQDNIHICLINLRNHLVQMPFVTWLVFSGAPRRMRVGNESDSHCLFLLRLRAFRRYGNC